MERDILKKSDGVFCQGIPAGYAFIEQHRSVWPIVDQCRVLEVSAGDYRAWLLAHIRAAFAARNQTFGWPRIRKQLRAQGLRAGKERVRKIMRRRGVRVRPRRRFRVTTDSSHYLPVAANLLRREFTADAPNTAWVGDSTCVWTAEGWLYLAMVIGPKCRTGA